MGNIGRTLVWLGFFGLIGAACWFLQSGWPLVGLIIMNYLPSFNKENENEKD